MYHYRKYWLIFQGTMTRSTERHVTLEGKYPSVEVCTVKRSRLASDNIVVGIKLGQKSENGTPTVKSVYQQNGPEFPLRG